jgi:adenylate kinase family enzyme
MSRILIIGSPGAGKTTLSRELASRMGIPLIHLDRLFWKPGWIEPNREQWAQVLEKELARPSWIIDGNYNSTLELRLQAADTAILLDLPTSVCLGRTLRRIILGWGRVRPDMADGCPERFDAEFLLYIWRFRRRQLPQTMERLSRFQGRTIILRNAHEIEEFAASFTEVSASRAKA